MRSDMRALLKIIGASFLLAVVVGGLLATAALGALSREVAIYLALPVFVVVALAIGRVFALALLRPGQGRNDSCEPAAPADLPPD
jgi:hypothetical protein